MAERRPAEPVGGAAMRAMVPTTPGRAIRRRIVVVVLDQMVRYPGPESSVDGRELLQKLVILGRSGR